MRLLPPKITSFLRVKSYRYFFFDFFDDIRAFSFMSQTNGRKKYCFFLWAFRMIFSTVRSLILKIRSSSVIVNGELWKLKRFDPAVLNLSRSAGLVRYPYQRNLNRFSIFA